MSRELLLGIDIGTTNAKGALVTPAGEIVAETSIRHAVSYPQPGWAEHDAQKVWWHDFVQLCRTLLGRDDVEASQVAGVSVSTLTPAVQAVDADFEPLYPAILYGLDNREAAETEELGEILGKDFSQKENLRPLLQKCPACKILWMKKHEPEIFSKTRYFMGAPSYLVYRLTGVLVADYACYKLAGLPFSLKKMGWHEEACAACGISVDQLPPLRFATERAGEVTAEAAAQTGLLQGTPVAVGTGDYPADSLSYGTRFLGMPQISYGSCVGVNNGSDPAALLFTDYETDWEMEAMPGGSMANGCVNIDWMRGILSGKDETQKLTNEDLEEMLRSIPAGSEGLIMLPYFNGEKAPFMDPDAKGVMYGLTLKHTKGHLYKASLESIGYAVRHILSLRTPDGKNEAFVVGGGTQIPGLLQTVSDITGYRQTALANHNGAVVGDAFIAGMACGMFTRRDQIDPWVKVMPTVEPNPAYRTLYDQGFETYRWIYQRLFS